MIKFRFSLALLFAFATSIISFAHNFVMNGIYYNLNDDGVSVSVTYRGNGSDEYENEYSGDVVIPSEVTYNGKTYSVTDIGYCALFHCTELTSVTIPNSVTSIGDSAFQYSFGLIKVEISDIAAWCNISFGNSGSNPLIYAKHLYLNGNEVTNLVIPNSVTAIGDYAFDGCSGLTSITIPNSVNSIGLWAFYGCSGLTKVEISDIAAWCNISFSSTSSNPLIYAKHLYLNGNEVTNLVIPNSVTSIGDCAFSGCSGLTSVTIPNSVTSIGDYAFSGCSGLTSITIPNSVTSIADSAFYGCSGLTSVTIGNSVTSIGDYAFYGCSGLTSITIPNSVTSIGDYAFYGCSGLTSITIPNSVTSIGNFAFYECSGLTSVTIPNSVTSIGKWAFFGCSGLTSITIPNSVTSIADSAFYGCSGLTSVTIPNSVTSIGDAAFEDCSGLTSVTIGNSVTSIGEWAFYDCSGLTSIQCDAATPPSLSTSVFEGVDKQNCSLIVPDGSLEAYKAADQWKDFLNIGGVEEIAIEESNISIENGKIINSNNENIEVYNLSGIKVYSGNKAEVELNSGVYIVVIGNKAVKIAL